MPSLLKELLPLSPELVRAQWGVVFRWRKWQPFQQSLPYPGD